jgi:predicted RecA/RadA family phage recombinase
MTLEARFEQVGDVIDWTADGDYLSGDVVQLRDGRAGVVQAECAAGDTVGVRVKGVVEVQKTTGMVMLPSSKAFWDHSANKAHLLHQNDRDFFLGTVVSEEAAADATVYVDLNVQPVFTVGFETGFASARVQTAGFVSAVGAGREGANLELSATNEAQKADALSHRGMAPGAEGIAHLLICVNTNGDAAALDANFGVANGTHATDADQIAESLFCHIDGASTALNFESDDGTTEVAATDSTLDFTAGTPFLVQFDLRDLASVKAYVNGVRVCDGTTGTARTFVLTAAAGPLKLLAHVEKTADDSPGNFSVLYGGICTAQV